MDDGSRRIRGRRSILLRVAAALVAVQLATGLLATGLSAYLASDRSHELALSSLRVRMDALAEEIERTAAPLDEGLHVVPQRVVVNLSYRFPDPIALVDAEGGHIRTIHPDPDAFEGPVADSTDTVLIPEGVREALEAGEIRIEAGSEAAAGGWAAAPLYDASGLLIGGYVIQPVSRTVSRELAPTLAAYRSALWTVVAVSVLLALLLAAVFAWWMVRPIRRIASRVSEIGSGEYGVRIDVRGEDEIALLGESVNRMADRVSASIESLRETDRMRRELVANVGHDLRTPLAALRGHLEESLRFHRESRHAEGVSAVASADRQAAYLQRLVDDLFELSVLETPSPQLRREPILPAELLREAAAGHLARMEADGIRLDVDIAGDLPVIEGDGVRLMRLLDNLLSNARRHTPSGGGITLSARSVDGKLEIVVGDTGEGMTSEELARIFDRYYRGEASRTRDEHGTGLGLAISRAVAELHGGRLVAESAPGEGTRMRLTLPIEGAG